MIRRNFFWIQLFFLGVFFQGTLFANQNFNNDPAVEQARSDYRVYLEQLKQVSQQYQEVTGQMKKVIQEEGLPVWDEKTGSITIQHELDMPQTDSTGTSFKETASDLVVSTELPGIRKESLRLTISEGRILKIVGEKKADQTKIERLIELPTIVQGEGPKARYEDGVLSITLKKIIVSKKEISVPVR